MLNLDQEFTNHLTKQDSVEVILREGVMDELLLVPTTKAVYQFVQHQFNDTGRIPTLKVLENEFPKITFEEPEGTVDYIIEKLRDRYQRNEIGDLLSDVAKTTIKNPSEALTKLRSAVFEIERTSLSNRHVWKPGDHKIFLRDLQQKVLAGAFKGTSVGFKEIDDFTGGIKDGNVVYILARMKRKKTWFTLNTFVAMALDGKRPYLFTLENGEEEIMLRISCLISGYPWAEAQKGNFMPNDYKMLEKAWEQFNQHEHYIEMPPMDERTVPSLTSKADKVDAGAIIISQFNYLTGTKDWYPQRHEKDAEVAVDLKRAATRPGKERPIVIEAQFNRGGDTMEELEDFTGSKVGLTDMIPQSADTLYGLFENKDMRASKQMEFGILEARNHGKASWFVSTELDSKTEFRVVQRK